MRYTTLSLGVADMLTLMYVAETEKDKAEYINHGYQHHPLLALDFAILLDITMSMKQLTQVVRHLRMQNPHYLHRRDLRQT